MVLQEAVTDQFNRRIPPRGAWRTLATVAHLPWLRSAPGSSGAAPGGTPAWGEGDMGEPEDQPSFSQDPKRNTNVRMYYIFGFTMDYTLCSSW